jgi:hypothetical protein
MLLTLVAAASMASADACHEGVLKQVVKDHDQTAPYVLVLASGERYRLYGQDFIDPRRWRAGDRLKVCLQEPPTARITDERLEEVLVGRDLGPSDARASALRPGPAR